VWPFHPMRIIAKPKSCDCDACVKWSDAKVILINPGEAPPSLLYKSNSTPYAKEEMMRMSSTDVIDMAVSLFHINVTAVA